MSIGCAPRKRRTAPVVTVDVAPVLTPQIQRTVTADALLYPRQQAAIVPKISAPVKKFYVERGARVRAGQLLAELENQDLAGAANESQAAYEHAEATYRDDVARRPCRRSCRRRSSTCGRRRTLWTPQQTVFDNRQRLFKEGAIAQKDVNDAQVALSQARNQYELARKHLEDLQGFAQRAGTQSCRRAT